MLPKSLPKSPLHPRAHRAITTTLLDVGRKPLLGIFLTTALLLSGCLEGKESIAASALKPGMVATVDGPTSEHLGLTPAYLAGTWCHTHVQFPKDRSEENIQYRFDSDTTFATQNNSSTAMRPGFKYQYKAEGRMKLATYAGFPKVVSVKPDAFVLHMFGDLHFRRGPCK